MTPREPSGAEREKLNALVRALHISELESAGQARARALAQADAELDRIAKRLPDALQGGLSLAEIARITGVSRPTLYELRGRYSDSERDLRLALLQTIATHSVVVGGLPELLKRPAGDIDSALMFLADNRLIDYEPDDDAEEPTLYYELTADGHGVLENWSFDDVDWADQP